MNGFQADTIVIYGFIAITGMKRVYNYLAKHGIELFTFAICDLTQLYSNNYDMPLYGLDENHYKTHKKLSHLGSIVSLETLRDMIGSYIPGMDQPGDWSERQSNLFNGTGNESGDIKGHLKKSIEFIKSLDMLNSTQPWYNEEIKKLTQLELEQLHKTISNQN
jgi:hypothetical protein